jgi:hypothetical protein
MWRERTIRVILQIVSNILLLIWWFDRIAQVLVTTLISFFHPHDIWPVQANFHLLLEHKVREVNLWTRSLSETSYIKKQVHTKLRAGIYVYYHSLASYTWTFLVVTASSTNFVPDHQPFCPGLSVVFSVLPGEFRVDTSLQYVGAPFSSFQFIHYNHTFHSTSNNLSSYYFFYYYYLFKLQMGFYLVAVALQ